MPNETIPFLLSLFWEILSPIGLPAFRKKFMKSDLDDFEKAEDSDTCLDLINYSADITQLTAGFATTIISFIFISYPVLAQVFYIIAAASIFIASILLLVFFYTIDPTRWFKFSLFGIWSIPTILAISTNIMFILFFIFNPQIKTLFPILYK